MPVLLNQSSRYLLGDRLVTQWNDQDHTQIETLVHNTWRLSLTLFMVNLLRKTHHLSHLSSLFSELVLWRPRRGREVIVAFLRKLLHLRRLYWLDRRWISKFVLLKNSKNTCEDDLKKILAQDSRCISQVSSKHYYYSNYKWVKLNSEQFL